MMNSALREVLEEHGEWERDSRFPVSGIRGWSVKRFHAETGIDRSALIKLSNNWQAVSGILISKDKDQPLLPIICHEEFRDVCIGSYRSRILKSALVIGGFLFFCMMLAASVGSNTTPLMMLLSGTIFLIFLLHERWIAATHPRVLIERVRFFSWLLQKRRFQINFYISTAIIIALGTSQILAIQVLGGQDELIKLIGTLYKKIDSREYWRLLTGGFLHASLLHFITNAIFFLAIVPTHLFFMSRWTIGLFFGAIVFGNAMEWIVASSGDGVAGISGGLFGLLGSLIIVSATTRMIPRPLCLPLLTLCAFSIGIGASIGRTANASHIAGLVFGVIATLLIYRPRFGH